MMMYETGSDDIANWYEVSMQFTTQGSNIKQDGNMYGREYHVKEMWTTFQSKPTTSEPRP